MRAAVHDVMTFWLNKRIDGFRADVINLISKAPGLPDAPVVLPGQRLQPAHTLFANGPRLHEFLRGLRSAVLNRYDCMVVGEMPWLSDRDQVLKVVGEARGELDMIFQFDMSLSPLLPLSPPPSPSSFTSPPLCPLSFELHIYGW